MSKDKRSIIEISSVAEVTFFKFFKYLVVANIKETNKIIKTLKRKHYILEKRNLFITFYSSQ